MNEFLAVLAKEWRSEARTRHGLFTAGLFSLLAVVAMGFASQGDRPGPTLAAGMLTVTLMFAAVSTLPRAFLAEEEQGTLTLLRLLASPAPAFLGKAVYNLIQLLATALAVAVLFGVLTGVELRHPGLFVLGLAAQCTGLAGTVSLCGLLVTGASNRWVLAVAVAMPLLLPQTALGIGALRVAYGEGTLAGGWQTLLGLAGFGLASFASAPALAAALWRR
jgi:ABC-type transport system involved in cytochrome c biogenesis permease component